MFFTFISLAMPIETASIIEESTAKIQVLHSQSDLKGWFEKNFERYANLFILDKDEILNMISNISIEKLTRLLEVMNQKSDQERIRLLKSIVEEEKMSIHTREEAPKTETKPSPNPAPKVLFFNHQTLLALVIDVFPGIQPKDQDKALEFIEKLWVRFGEAQIYKAFHELVNKTNYLSLTIDQKINVLKKNLQESKHAF